MHHSNYKLFILVLWRLNASSPPLCFPVRSHACEVDQFGKPGGCSDICLLGNGHKTRTCRCRSGFSLGSDGKSCKSECCLCNSLLKFIISAYKTTGHTETGAVEGAAETDIQDIRWLLDFKVTCWGPSEEHVKALSANDCVLRKTNNN